MDSAQVYSVQLIQLRLISRLLIKSKVAAQTILLCFLLHCAEYQKCSAHTVLLTERGWESLPLGAYVSSAGPR